MESSPFSLSPKSIDYLNTTRKWAMFLAVLGFIGIFFLVLMSLSIGFVFNFADMPTQVASRLPVSPTIIALFYIFIAAALFIPVWYLFQFSKRMKKALATNNEELITHSFSNLKNFFLAYGILTILSILLYFLFIIIGAFAALGTMGAVAA